VTTPRERFFLVALVIVAGTVWLYAPVREFQLVNWDDDLYLAETRPHVPVTMQTVRWAFTTCVPFYYHPLTWLSHAVDLQLWGARYAGPHLVNVALHALNAVAVLAVCWLVWGEARWLLAAGVAAVFAVHPLQVESVAWLAERKTVLCGFFSLWCVAAYLRGWRRTALGLYALALWSKPMAVPLPVVLLALDVWPLRRSGWRRLVGEKWAYWLLAVAFSAVTFLAQAEWGAVHELGRLGMGARGLVAARAAVFYVWRLAWPAWLSPYYPIGSVSGAPVEFGVPVVIVLLVTAGCVGRWRSAPVLLLAWGSYLALLAPMSGLVQVGPQAVAPRFVYLALVPVLMLMAAGLWWCWQHVGPAGRGALVLFVAAVLVFNIHRTRADLPSWRDEESLWRAALRYFPESGVANFHYALALVEQRRFAEALPHAEYAVTVIPDNPLAQLTLGVARLKTGRFAAAEAALREALRQIPENPTVRYNLACALSRQGRVEEARRWLTELLAQSPSYRAIAARDPDLAAVRELSF